MFLNHAFAGLLLFVALPIARSRQAPGLETRRQLAAPLGEQFSERRLHDQPEPHSERGDGDQPRAHFGESAHQRLTDDLAESTAGDQRLAAPDQTAETQFEERRKRQQQQREAEATSHHARRWRPPQAAPRSDGETERESESGKAEKTEKERRELGPERADPVAHSAAAGAGLMEETRIARSVRSEARGEQDRDRQEEQADDLAALLGR